jgi:putative sterol carrier protein
MPREAFGPEWTRAWVEAIRESAEYRTAAARWEGSVLLIARGEPGIGMPEDRRVYLDLHRGECRDGRVARPEDEALADFVLSADLPTWKDVLGGVLDPLAGLARGRLKLEKGGLASLAMHAGAAKALVRTAAELDTRFPGED